MKKGYFDAESHSVPDPVAVLAAEAARSATEAQDKLLEMRAEMAKLRENVRTDNDAPLAKARAEISALREEIDLLRAKADRAAELEKRANDLLASTSWRITGPLRRLSRLFGRG